MYLSFFPYRYRAFYDRAFDGPVKDEYKVGLLPQGKLAVGWIATEKNFTDLLIARFDPFGAEEVEETAEYFRKDNPSLGKKAFKRRTVCENTCKTTAFGYGMRRIRRNWRQRVYDCSRYRFWYRQ